MKFRSYDLENDIEIEFIRGRPLLSKYNFCLLRNIIKLHLNDHISEKYKLYPESTGRHSTISIRIWFPWLLLQNITSVKIFLSRRSCISKVVAVPVAFQLECHFIIIWEFLKSWFWTWRYNWKPTGTATITELLYDNMWYVYVHRRIMCVCTHKRASNTEKYFVLAIKVTYINMLLYDNIHTYYNSR